jgi:hypothetical protein
MRELQAKAREARERAERLPLELSELRVAAIQLSLCVSCSVSLAMNSCDGARNALQRGSRSLSKVK